MDALAGLIPDGAGADAGAGAGAGQDALAGLIPDGAGADAGAGAAFPAFPAFPEGSFPAFPDSEITGFPAEGFDPNDFDSFGEVDFGAMDINMEIPDVADLVAQMESLFTQFEPDAALFDSFNDNDIGKLKDSFGGYMKELKIDVSDAVQKAVAEAFAKGEPTEQELIDLGIPADKVKEIKGDKVNSLFGGINFFEDLKPEEIATDIEDKLKDFKKDLEAGLPKGMDTKKFAELVNKKGCDTQGLKKMLADPAKFNKEYKPPADDKKDATTEGRRRADNEGIKNYGKTQVKNQAKLAGTQQAAATAPTGSGSGLFVSTLTVGLSVAGSYFVF